MHEVAHCQRCAHVVPWVSLFGNLGLGVYKLVVGLIGRSAALVADAMHSFTDVVGSTGIVVATRISRKPPDGRFPYGRGKAEFVGAVLVYTILIFFAVLIVVGSIQSLLKGQIERPHFITAFASGVSVYQNYLMYRFETCIGRRTNSPAIMADAFENRADALSSLAAVVGILAALIFDPLWDRVAAILVGVFIFWNCVTQLRDAAFGLMDGGLPRPIVEEIERTAKAQPGVLGVQFMRSRRTGARYWVDLGIRTSRQLSIAKADQIAAALRDYIKHLPQCHHVEVYVVPDSTPAEPVFREPQAGVSRDRAGVAVSSVGTDARNRGSLAGPD
jgi:cation diffusion facilitator family transporter